MRNYITTLDPFFDSFFLRANNCSVSHMMKTDIIETKDNYKLFIDLPEVKKEDIKVSLEEGYLKIFASISREENDEETYIYRERSNGEYSRSYYVGDAIKINDVTAKLDNGVLTITIKKPDMQEIEKAHTILVA